MKMIEIQYKEHFGSQGKTSWVTYDVYDPSVRTAGELEEGWSAAIQGSPTRTWRMVEREVVDTTTELRGYTP